MLQIPNLGNAKCIFDTNILLDAPEILNGWGSIDVVIPTPVIDELDHNKTKDGPTGANARQSAARLDLYTKQASSMSIDLHKDGVPLGGGKGRLFIHGIERIHPKLKQSYNGELAGQNIADNLIISAAIEVKERAIREANKAKNEKSKKQRKKIVPTRVVLISNDVLVRVKARTLGIEAHGYAIEKEIYSGVENITLSAELIAELQKTRKLPYKRVRDYLGEKAPKPCHYEFFAIKCGDSDGKIYSYFHEDSLILMQDEECRKMYGSISTKNDEQRLAMRALLNPDVELITISGPAGTGKTLLALCAALQLEKSFKQIVITRKIIGLNGSDYGFLPGDGKKKVDPYMKSIYDNLDFIKSHCNDGEQGNGSGKSKKGGKLSKIDDLINDESRFVIEPLAYIRGGTYPFTYFIVEEAQNLSRSDLLALITRIGENSKMILIGDPDQTDFHYMDRYNNGFTYAIERFKNYPKAAHITLVKGERSSLSEWASKNL